MVAVSSNVKAVTEFGMDAAKILNCGIGLVDVTSAVGVFLLALQYGFDVVQKFLEDSRDMNQHFLIAASRENLPVFVGLSGVWNSSFLGYGTRAILSYSESMVRFAALLQHVDMKATASV